MCAQHNKPALRMIVAPGRLVSADAYTEEQLEVYPQGTVVEVRVVRERSSWRRRKERRFWAILGKAVAVCGTPWQNSDEASDAIKLKLGVVDRGASTTGQVISYPAKTSVLDDSEYAAFYEGAMAILHKVTGVDPETLRKEAGLEPDSEPAPPEAGSADQPAEADESADAAGGGEQEAVGLIAETLAVADPPPDATPHGLPEEGSDDRPQQKEAVNKIMALARNPDVSVRDRVSDIKAAAKLWNDALPGREKFVAMIASTAEKVALGQLQGPSATSYLISQIAK